MADPVKASAMGVATISDVCGGPIIKYPVLCGIWSTSLVAGLLTGNPTLIAISVEYGTQILEEIYD